MPGLVTVELSGLPQHPLVMKNRATFAQLVDVTWSTLLPTFQLFDSPAHVAHDLPTAWLGMIEARTIEWAIAMGDRDAATLLVRRHLERPLRGKQTWETRLRLFTEGFETEELNGINLHGERALGWLSRAHDLVEPSTIERPSSALARAPGRTRSLLRFGRKAW